MLLERDFQVRQEQINEQLRQRELERQLALAARVPPVHQFRLSGGFLRRTLRRTLRRILRFRLPRFAVRSTEPC